MRACVVPFVDGVRGITHLVEGMVYSYGEEDRLRMAGKNRLGERMNEWGKGARRA
jgi:hypothetical protein